LGIGTEGGVGPGAAAKQNKSLFASFSSEKEESFLLK
jgi:hypothetical protein